MSYHMPAEYEPHEGTVMIYPSRPGSWNYGAKNARIAFKNVANAISESEKVWMLAGKDCYEAAIADLSENPNITILKIETDDAWARDVGPTVIVDDKGNRKGVDWCFNAWGGDFDGLYKHWENDDKAAKEICQSLNIERFDMHPFVLEGGSIHSDGEGTLLVTESCLLSQGRNPKLSKTEIEQILCKTLGMSKVLWLPRGIYNDETNEHVDNIAAFVKPAEIALAWTDDKNDPQYELSKADFDYLSTQRDAKGRAITVYKVPIPSKSITITENDLLGYSFEEGEDVREVGERLAASYINFYISNNGVLVPQFDDVNDSLACEILSALFPDRKIYPIKAREILLGGGNIHCITQQIPR